MSYKIGQLVYNSDGSDSEDFMVLLTEGRPARRKTIGFTAESSFEDECVVVDSEFEEDTSYYLHCKIKRQENETQQFAIYLVKYANDSVSLEKTQYLKTITNYSRLSTNSSALEDTWADFEFCFTPLVEGFDCILFKLKRTSGQSSTQPVIFYEELSKINNIIETKKLSPFVKLGVQAAPGLMMNINGAEIHVGASGIYELYDGLITIDSFSVVQAAEENPTFPDFLQYIDLKKNNYSTSSLFSLLGNLDESACAFKSSKKRSIKSFILDYKYKGGN